MTHDISVPISIFPPIDFTHQYNVYSIICPYMLLPPTIFLKASSKHTRSKYPRQHFFLCPTDNPTSHLFVCFGSINSSHFYCTFNHGKYVLLFFLPTPRVVSKGDGSVMPRRQPRPFQDGRRQGRHAMTSHRRHATTS
jgi:hypothetical protein